MTRVSLVIGFLGFAGWLGLTTPAIAAGPGAAPGPAAGTASARAIRPAPALAIRGYDPVAYFTLQKATPGDARYTVDWDEHRWQFASARHRDLFKAEPARYAPQFASFCAVALSRGELLPANPEYWLISDGKLYLFGKQAGPALFRRNLDQSLEKARQNSGLISGQ